MEISQNDTLLNNSKTKNVQYWENQGYQIQNWNLYSLMPERMLITKNRIDAGEVAEKDNFLYIVDENID